LYFKPLGSKAESQDSTAAATFQQADILEYNMSISVRSREITGICFISGIPSDTIKGTVVNEFGIKAFDFLFTGGKAKILNVFKPINKWYIKKMLRHDLEFMLPLMMSGKKVVRKKRSINHMDNGEIMVRNDRYGINYTFIPINQAK